MFRKPGYYVVFLATFQVQNAFTITKYTGYDPEVGLYNYGGVNIVGMEEEGIRQRDPTHLVYHLIFDKKYL